MAASTGNLNTGLLSTLISGPDGFRGDRTKKGRRSPAVGLFTSPSRPIRVMTEFIQVFTTVNSKDSANEVANTLLGARVASCVQVFGPIDSSYWWKGRIERVKEWLCLIKAKEKDYRLIEASIKKVHPYAVSEILALPVLKGNSDYLRWIRTETSRKPRGMSKPRGTRKNLTSAGKRAS